MDGVHAHFVCNFRQTKPGIYGISKWGAGSTAACPLTPLGRVLVEGAYDDQYQDQHGRRAGQPGFIAPVASRGVVLAGVRPSVAPELLPEEDQASAREVG